jgi:hypothetical protein
MTAALHVLVTRLDGVRVLEAAEPSGGILRSSARVVATWAASA